jgi:hypothetical protein
MKLRRLCEAYPIEDAPTLEDWLLDLANARGVTVVSRSLDKLEGCAGKLPGRDEVSDAALVVALCQLQGLDRPPWLRAAAQLITKGAVDMPKLLHLARRERVERILAELARQAHKMDADHSAWCAIEKAFGDAPPFRDSLVHWSRLAEPEMRPDRPNAAAWHLVG